MTAFTYFEPLHEGHCAFWAASILEHAATDTRITRLRLVTNPEIRERLGTLIKNHGIEVETLAPEALERFTQGGLLSRGKAQWAAARSELATTAGGVVFQPFFDHAVVAAALDRRPAPQGGRISGVIFRPPNTYGLPVSPRRLADTTRRWATYLLARGPALGRLFTLDETAGASWVGRVSRTLTFLPDPTPDLSMLSACAPRTRSDGRAVALLFGALTERKGIFQILEAWGQMDDAFLARNALRLAGRLGKDERAPFLDALAKVRERRPAALIELEDRFLSDAELAQDIVDADLILAPYQNHVGSSGVLYWAAAAGKPLLTQNTGLIGYQVERYRLGNPVDCSKPKSIASALYERRGPSGNLGDFLNLHSLENFSRTIVDGMLDGFN